jgi:hypothetical protein
MTTIEPHRAYRRTVERNDVTGELVQRVSSGGGMHRLNKLGWEFGSSVDQSFTVRDGDPTSARMEIRWTTHFRRPGTDFDVRSETRSTLACTQDKFLYWADEEAYEGERRVYARAWSTEVERDLN